MARQNISGDLLICTNKRFPMIRLAVGVMLVRNHQFLSVVVMPCRLRRVIQPKDSWRTPNTPSPSSYRAGSRCWGWLGPTSPPGRSTGCRSCRPGSSLSSCIVNKWMNEWMDEWMNEWINEWMNEWMNEGRNEGMNQSTRKVNWL